MTDELRVRWYRQLTGYHWFVFLVASACWCFDCLDQRLFSLARIPALRSLTPADTPIGAVQALGKDVTAIFLVGWGIGGLIFGALGDRWGRARMLTITVLLYSVFTGLTFFSQTYWDFAACRFITGLGVGGVFGLAVALIAETVPDGARAGALGMLQVLSTIGNLSAGAFKTLFDYFQRPDVALIAEGSAWRYMFLVGALPAALVIFTAKFLREPEPWLRAKAEGRLPAGSILAPYFGLLAEKQWRKNLLVGAVLASTGVIGLWAIGEYAVDLQRSVFRLHYEQQGAPTDEIPHLIDSAITRAYLLNMIGAAFGMWAFTRVAMTLGRRAAFAMGFTAALAVTAMSYYWMNSPADAYWMMPLMGAAQLAPFAGFAIYLPELFPSRLRSTGTSFCYNLGRFAAAGGSLFSAKLATGAYGHLGSPLMERYSAITMCVIFLAGLAILPFAPETRNRPLPQ
ncbi:MAG: MFS transporter [Pirellulales bacterium]|nr:MFS transporter [Pirellulales bacterium]